MTIHRVEVVVDCEAVENGASGSRAVNMYASQDIVLSNSQGSYELSIRVDNDDIIRWSAFPKVVQPEGSNENYSVIIDAEHDWNNNTLLKDWTAYQGNMPVYVYERDAIPMRQDQRVNIERQTAYQPFVQANATLPGRPNPGVSQTEAYTFYVKVYKGTELIKEINWDPYVTVVQP
ncbi:AidA/PixA family protein [Pseudoalteromonas sp. T1lg23B]|uniref:AidA/PixA family protein n=1 Tax=Pseudoalteromonas sp. T1lg23B TaxID=2077097 RepID=UPI000CF6ABEF|nr:AidA/PixA family protein [Pseudoalteromonas sp. T1lg23B]